jgi:hypothetical protein
MCLLWNWEKTSIKNICSENFGRRTNIVAFYLDSKLIFVEIWIIVLIYSVQEIPCCYKT